MVRVDALVDLFTVDGYMLGRDDAQLDLRSLCCDNTDYDTFAQVEMVTNLDVQFLHGSSSCNWTAGGGVVCHGLEQNLIPRRAPGSTGEAWSFGNAEPVSKARFNCRLKIGVDAVAEISIMRTTPTADNENSLKINELSFLKWGAVPE